MSHDSTTSRKRPERPHISIVVPVYNEEQCVEPLIERIGSAMAGVPCDYEILFVDDGSQDSTLEKISQAAARDPHVLYLSFSRNFGHQVALYAGIDHARGDAVVSLDGDLQHPPELIPTLIEHWRAGYDIVYTVRMDNRGHAVKEFFSRGYYWLLRKLTGVEVPTGGADFRLIDRKVADALRACDERFVFIRGLIPWLGFRRKAIGYEAAPRYSGSTKYAVRKMLAFAFDGVFSFSTVPLRLISLLGLVTTALGLLYGGYTVWVRLFSDRAVSGWASLVVVVLVFSGTQLLSLGILSEYVGRIYEEVKHRPRYVVAARSPALEGEQ